MTGFDNGNEPHDAKATGTDTVMADGIRDDGILLNDHKPTAAMSDTGTGMGIKPGAGVIKSMADSIKSRVEEETENEKREGSISSTEKALGTIKKSAGLLTSGIGIVLQATFPVVMLIGAIICIVIILATLAALFVVSANTVEPEKYVLAVVSRDVYAHKDETEYYAGIYSAEQYIQELLAIMETETGGRETDIMHSFEYLNLPQDTLTEQESIDRGVQYFSRLIQTARDYGCDTETAIQAYNYGSEFIGYVSRNGKKYTYELAVNFAREKSEGKTTEYKTDISVSENGGWKYDYGNMFYVSEVKKHLIETDNKAARIIFESITACENGNGTVLRGAEAVRYHYGKAGYLIPETETGIYGCCEILLYTELKAGDMLFFKESAEAEGISHVCIYAGNDRIYSPYGEEHFTVTAAYSDRYFAGGGRLIYTADG